MLPKTKYHVYVAGLQKKVRRLSCKVRNWTYKNCFFPYAVVSRKTFYCTECGQSWKPDCYLAEVLLECKCPHCNRVLKLKYDDLHFVIHDYAAVIEIHDNFQVIRMLYVTKYCDKGKPARYSAFEVMQHWIDTDGRMTTFALKCRGLSMYYDAWCFDTELEIRSKTENSLKRTELHPSEIFPARQIHPLITRNGFKGEYHEFTPHLLFSMLLRDPIAETLLKADQIKLLEHRHRDPRKSDLYWNSIKICIRNNYTVSNAGDWFDYLDLLSYFRKDLHNEKFVCPPDLSKVHDELVRRKQAIDLKITQKELQAKFERAQVGFLKRRKQFLDLKFQKDDLVIQPLQSVEEFFLEGKSLHHCIYTNNYFDKKDSLILSAKIANQRIETIELSLSKLAVLQSRGLQNKPTLYHEEIVNLVQTNIPQIRKRLQKVTT